MTVMTRKFMIYDVVSCLGIDKATVSYVGDDFLKTDKGWLTTDRVILVRPFNLLYKGQFKPFDETLLANNRPSDLADKIAGITLCAISKMMEK